MELVGEITILVVKDKAMMLGGKRIILMEDLLIIMLVTTFSYGNQDQIQSK